MRGSLKKTFNIFHDTYRICDSERNICVFAFTLFIEYLYKIFSSNGFLGKNPTALVPAYFSLAAVLSGE